MLYLGRGRLALVYFAAPLAIKAIVGITTVYHLVPSEYAILYDYRLTFDVLDFGAWAIGLVHAVLSARRMKGEIPQVWFARWYVPLLILVGIWTLQELLY